MKHYKSVFDNEQELLKAVIDLHLKGKDIELDPMYFKGNFYKDGVNKPKYIFDINPQTLDCPQGDATELVAYLKDCVDSIILDPPFMFGGHGKQDKFYSSRTHGILTWDNLEKLYKDILGQAYLCLN